MKFFFASIAAALFAFTAPAFAEGKITNKVTAVSQSAAAAQANNKINNPRSAPGIAAGGGDCTYYVGLTVVGGGFVAGGPGRHCVVSVNAQTANTYIGRRAARAYICQQSAFRSLRECGGSR